MRQRVVPALEQRLGTRIWLLQKAGLVGGRGRRADRRGRLEVEPADPSVGSAGARTLGRPARARRPSACATRAPERRLLAELPRRARAGRRARGARAVGAAGLARRRPRLARARGGQARPLAAAGSSRSSTGASRRCCACETDGPDLYFKVSARLPLFVEEGAGDRDARPRGFPGYVPAPLAVEPEQGWMLLPELRRAHRLEGTARSPRGAHVRALCGLQRRSSARSRPMSCSPPAASTGGSTCSSVSSSRSSPTPPPSRD